MQETRATLMRVWWTFTLCLGLLWPCVAHANNCDESVQAKELFNRKGYGWQGHSLTFKSDHLSLIVNSNDDSFINFIGFVKSRYSGAGRLFRLIINFDPLRVVLEYKGPSALTEVSKAEMGEGGVSANQLACQALFLKESLERAFIEGLREGDTTLAGNFDVFLDIVVDPEVPASERAMLLSRADRLPKIGSEQQKFNAFEKDADQQGIEDYNRWKIFQTHSKLNPDRLKILKSVSDRACKRENCITFVDKSAEVLLRHAMEREAMKMEVPPK